MKKVVTLLLVLSLVMVFSASTVFAADDEYKLGILLPLTGTFAPVAETQRDGIIFAAEEINAEGGLDMPWGKAKVTYSVKDDEADLKVGVRRLMYLKQEGVDAVLGQTWSPLAVAVNESVKRDPIPYFPVCIMSKEICGAGNLAPYTWAATYTPYTVGYMAAKAAVTELGKKEIFWLSRSDSWGWGIGNGVKAAAKEYGAEIVGEAEVSMGTTDFTTVIEQVKDSGADVFISAQFAGDAIALLKQSYDMGLYDEVTMFNAFITNVVAKGLPAEAREGIYSMHFFYWDMAGFEDEEVAARAKDMSERYIKQFGHPPDSYAVMAYIAAKRLLDAVERAGSFDKDAVNQALADSPVYDTVKGPATWRASHEPIYKYAAFLVRGKAAEDSEGEWDLFDVISAQGGEEVMMPLEQMGY